MKIFLYLELQHQIITINFLKHSQSTLISPRAISFQMAFLAGEHFGTKGTFVISLLPPLGISQPLYKRKGFSSKSATSLSPFIFWFSILVSGYCSVSPEIHISIDFFYFLCLNLLWSQHFCSSVSPVTVLQNHQNSYFSILLHCPSIHPSKFFWVFSFSSKAGDSDGGSEW